MQLQRRKKRSAKVLLLFSHFGEVNGFSCTKAHKKGKSRKDTNARNHGTAGLNQETIREVWCRRIQCPRFADDLNRKAYWNLNLSASSCSTCLMLFAQWDYGEEFSIINIPPPMHRHGGHWLSHISFGPSIQIPFSPLCFMYIAGLLSLASLVAA